MRPGRSSSTDCPATESPDSCVACGRMNLRRTRGPFIPAEPAYADAGYELKAMDCIAKNADRDDVRRLFRIEVR